MQLINVTPQNKGLVLGTALWGWGIERHDAYKILERYLERGGAVVDCATNYPINKRSEDFGLSLKWLADWVAANENSNLSLIVKVGSIDNLGGPEVDLSPSRIHGIANELNDLFGRSLSCISIHWDNRDGSEGADTAVDSTVKAMSDLRQQGFEIGLSGIKTPSLYHRANPNLSVEWLIQVKENFLTHDARMKYQEFFPDARYLAYGINLGGLKKEPAKQSGSMTLRGINVDMSITASLTNLIEANRGLEPRPQSINELALLYGYVNPALSGLIVGPRDVSQLVNTMQFWDELKVAANCTESKRLIGQYFDSWLKP